jgi:hypothetical protein
MIFFRKVKDNDSGFYSFIWFDYTCVPQGKDKQAIEERNQQLLAIANIMKKCQVQPFFMLMTLIKKHINAVYGVDWFVFSTS